MQAVWTFWTKPFLAQGRSPWASERAHLLAWVLSLQTARQHYPRTALYTDTPGARLLVDRLGLEFTHVSTALDALAGSDPACWALGKVYTYSLQTEPFVHLDSDVFLWKRLPERIESAPIFGQHPDELLIGASYYEPEKFGARAGWLPEEWTWYGSLGRRRRAVCCGIVGGHRLDFLTYYATLALRLAQNPANRRAVALLGDRTNVLFEQYLLSACLNYHRRKTGSPFFGIDLGYLFSGQQEAFDSAASARAGYTHLIAGAKQNQTICARIERRVESEHAELYRRVTEQASSGTLCPPDSRPLRPRATTLSSAELV